MHSGGRPDRSVVGAGQFVGRLVGPFSDQAMERGQIDRRDPSAAAIEREEVTGVVSPLDPANEVASPIEKRSATSTYESVPVS
jgi:hypothetical protein